MNSTVRPAGRGDIGAGLVEHFAELFHAGRGGVQVAEIAFRVLGDEFGQRRFPGSRRAVEDDGSEPVGFDQPPQQFAFGEEMLLADEFGQRLRPHPCRQRFDGRAVFGFSFGERGSYITLSGGRQPPECSVQQSRHRIQRADAPRSEVVASKKKPPQMPSGR